MFGVVEGFYGKPWSTAQRNWLVARMKEWGLTHYLYAPKDDDRHRTHWRELYEEDSSELKWMKSISDQVNVIYALAPGLDANYSSEEEMRALKAKLKQLVEVGGVKSFALLFDDIAEELCSEDKERFGSVAAAHCHFANEAAKYLSDGHGIQFVTDSESRAHSPSASAFLFCPTPYCSAFCNDGRDVTKSEYLREIGKSLSDVVGILWTGREIISHSITGAHVREVSEILCRKPVIWDNLFANDYDVNRAFMGPIKGRDSETLSSVAGILLNPNCELDLNFVPLRTLSLLVQEGPNYNASVAHLQAVKEWLPWFYRPLALSASATCAEDVKEVYFGSAEKQLVVEDLLLLCDLFFLPSEHGPRAQFLYDSFRTLLNKDNVTVEEARAFTLQCHSIEQLKEKVTGISNRDLLYALYTYLWGINEEQDLMSKYINHKACREPLPHFQSQFHQPHTYRGGIVRDLQELLPMSSQGIFSVSKSVTAQNPFFIIRPFRDSDEEAVYRVCLETGDEGADGTHLFADKRILGHRWAGPYLTGKDCAFVLEDEKGVCGYTLGSLDTEEFNARFLSEWAPKMRSIYPTRPNAEKKSSWSEDEKVLEGFYEPELLSDKDLITEYPAHLHIDITARGQGKGMGTRLMKVLLDELLSSGVTGVHLEMAPNNDRAFAFYKKLGFKELKRNEDDLVLGKKLL